MKQFKHHQILDLVKPYLSSSPTIVEAGAFDGTDTKKMSLLWPEGSIHAFEPVPKNFEILKHATTDYKNIHCYPLALSDVSGYATFYTAVNPSKPEKPCQAGSLLAPKERLGVSPMVYQDTIQVPSVTLDDWAREHDVSQVDFLWFDMQGHELSVIKSSPSILKTVKVIYTEVHFIEAYQGQSSYSEIKDYLESMGFEMVARDFTEPPSWFFGNALFVRL